MLGRWTRGGRNSGSHAAASAEQRASGDSNVSVSHNGDGFDALEDVGDSRGGSSLKGLATRMKRRVRRSKYEVSGAPGSDPTRPERSYAPSGSDDTPAPGGRVTDAVEVGDVLWKVPFSKVAAPQRRFFQVVRAKEGLVLQWSDPARRSQKPRHVALGSVTSICEGHKTWPLRDVVTKLGCASVRDPRLCFSLIAKDRTIDMAAMTLSQRNYWVEGLRAAVFGVAAAVEAASSLATPAIAGRTLSRGTRDSAEAAGVVAGPSGGKRPVSTGSLHAAEGQHVVPKQHSQAPGRRRPAPAAAAGGGPTMSMEDITYWSAHLFDHVRHNRLHDVAAAFDHGCPVDLQESSTGDTALLIACRHGWREIADLCLRRGARNDPHPHFGHTALQTAVVSQQAGVVDLLLTTAAASGAASTIVNHADDTGSAALHVAASNGDVRCLEILLNHGANTLLVDGRGRTPLHLACEQASNADPSRHCDCAALLVEAGGDSLLNRGDHDGNTPLHIAAARGILEMVRWLLETAANPLFMNAEQKMPIELADAGSHRACLKLLREYESLAAFQAEGSVTSRCLRDGSEGSDGLVPVRHGEAGARVTDKGTASAARDRPRTAAGGRGSSASHDASRRGGVRPTASGLSTPGQESYPPAANAGSRTLFSGMTTFHKAAEPSRTAHTPAAAGAETNVTGGVLSAGVHELDTPAPVAQDHMPWRTPAVGSAPLSPPTTDAWGTPTLAQGTFDWGSGAASDAAEGCDDNQWGAAAAGGSQDYAAGYAAAVVDEEVRADAAGSAVASEGTGAAQIAVDGGSVFTTEGAQPTAGSGTVDRWQTSYTESGDVYYTNLTTGHSQWEDPRVAAQSAIRHETGAYPAQFSATGGEQNGWVTVAASGVSAAGSVHDGYVETPADAWAHYWPSGDYSEGGYWTEAGQYVYADGSVYDPDAPAKAAPYHDQEDGYGHAQEGDRDDGAAEADEGMSERGDEADATARTNPSPDGDFDSDASEAEDLGTPATLPGREHKKHVRPAVVSKLPLHAIQQGPAPRRKRRVTGQAKKQNATAATMSPAGRKRGTGKLHRSPVSVSPVGKADEHSDDDEDGKKAAPPDEESKEGTSNGGGVDPRISKYARMVKMGLPIAGPVRQRMVMDGLSDADIESLCSVLAELGGDGALRAASGAPKSPIRSRTPSPDKASPLPRQSPIVTRKSPPTAAPKLLMHKADYEKYVKMIKMGLPLNGPVRQRMVMDGVADTMIDRFISEAEAHPDQVGKPPPKASAAAPEEPAATAPAPQHLLQHLPEFEKYVKMVKMGLPLNGPVRQRMTMDGVAPDEIDRFIAEAQSCPADALGKAPPAAAASPASPPKAAGAAPSPRLLVHQPDFDKYVKMIKMGLPLEGPIRQRMTMDGVDADKIDRFLKEAATYPDEVGKKPPTRKQSPGSQRPLLLVHQPKYEKFHKMLKMGLPLQGPVRQRMVMDGVDGEVVEQFVKEVEANPDCLDKPPPKSSERLSPLPKAPRTPDAAAQAESRTSLTSDPKFAKYVKMKSFGVPLEAVSEKMKIDGVTEDEVQSFIKAFGTPTTIRQLAAAAPGSARRGQAVKRQLVPLDVPRPATAGGGAGSRAVGERKTSVQTLKLHWNTLPADRLQASVWATPRANAALTDLGESDIKNLETMFRSAPATRPSAAAGGAGGTKKSKAAAPKAEALLEFKRANNVSIGLAQFRRFPNHVAVFSAVYRLDGEQLSAERLEQLLELMPTAPELRLVQGYKGDASRLGAAEQWFRSVGSVQRLKAKVEAALFRARFAEIDELVSGHIELLRAGCEQVMSSERLASVLMSILAIGNIMNSGTDQGGAQGFRLDSLPRLAATKAVDRKTTLIDYLVTTLESKGGADLLKFPDDLPAVREARRMKVSDLCSEVTALRGGLTRLRREASAESADLREEKLREEKAEGGGDDGKEGGDGDGDNADDADGGDSPAPKSAPANPMFAELLARSKQKKKQKKRAGPAGASAPAVPNPCTREVRQMFVRTMEEFAETAGARVDALQKDANELRKLQSNLAAFFGEEDSCTTDHVFEVLFNFLRDFERSRQQLVRKRKAAAKKAASRGSKSTSKRRSKTPGKSGGKGTPSKGTPKQGRRGGAAASPGVSELPSGRTAARRPGELEALGEKMRVVLQQWGVPEADAEAALKALVRPPLSDLRAMMQSPETLRAAVDAFFEHAGRASTEQRAP